MVHLWDFGGHGVPPLFKDLHFGRICLYENPKPVRFWPFSDIHSWGKFSFRGCGYGSIWGGWGSWFTATVEGFPSWQGAPRRAPLTFSLFGHILTHTHISHKVFLKSFRKSQIPHKSVNLFCILVIVKDQLTDLWVI